MSFSTVFERLNSPRNYYSNNYASQWRGMVTISYISQGINQIVSQDVTTFKRLKKTINQLPPKLMGLRVVHCYTTQGNLFRLPIVWQLKTNVFMDLRRYSCELVIFYNFPRLQELPIPPNIIPIGTLKIHQCPWMNYERYHPAVHLEICGPSNGPLIHIPHLDIKNVTLSGSVKLQNCYIGTIDSFIQCYSKWLADHNDEHKPKLYLRNCQTEYYDFSNIGDTTDDWDKVIPYDQLIPVVLQFKNTLNFPLLYMASFFTRHKKETFLLSSLLVNTEPILFTSTLASNPLRRASEFI
jgi:hypothetical protein